MSAFKSAPCYSFGLRHRHQKNNKNPGPGHYNWDIGYDKTGKGIPQYGFSKEKKSNINTTNTKTGYI